MGGGQRRKWVIIWSSAFTVVGMRQTNSGSSHFAESKSMLVTLYTATKRLLRLVLACTTEDIGRTRSVTLNRLLALNHWSLQLLWHVLSLMAWPWQLILIASEPHFMYYWCLPALVHVNMLQNLQRVPDSFLKGCSDSHLPLRLWASPGIKYEAKYLSVSSY